MINEFYVCNATLKRTIARNKNEEYQIWLGEDKSFLIFKSDKMDDIFWYCKENKIHLNNFELIN